MKKPFLLLVLTLAIFNLIAQDIMLTFHPVDPENKIDSIRAINTLTGTSFIEASNTINMSSFTTRIELLTNTLGGELVAGGKLKEAGTKHWLDPNSEATDSTGFQGLPGGLRNPGWGNVHNPSSGGNFESIGEEGHWHSATEYDNRSINRRYLRYDNSQIGKWDPYLKGSGFSIRCIKD